MNKPKFFVTPGYGEQMLNELHYSQAVRIGDRVEISGQGGVDDNLQIPESLADEIAQTFRNVERTLMTAGTSWEHVVHINSYHVGGFPPEVNDVMVKLFRHYMPNHDTHWTFVGDKTLKGKEAVRQWMTTTYIEAPKFRVANLIAEGDFVTAIGDITIKDEDGKSADYSYCDIWRFRGDKIVELKAFVIKTEVKNETSSAA